MKKKNIPDYYFLNKEKSWHEVSEKKWNDWKWQLKNSINSESKLLNFFKELNRTDLKRVSDKYKFSITPYFLSLIDHNDKKDPLYKQVIPDKNELKKSNNLKLDPFNERKSSPLKHVIKRYTDRIIITTTNNCASYCRYCTRKWMWQDNFTLNNKEIKKIIDYIKKDKHIRDVILSGGEPFLLPSDILENLISGILDISHVDMIRIGTRILSFLPQRIDRELVKMISGYKPVWIITHFNHPNEITSLTEKAVDQLIGAKTALCNQTVFLKNINDDYEVLKQLFYKLTSLRIKPYYLFQCDPVEGTSHFHASLKAGIELIKSLRNDIDGLCIPDYVQDTPKNGKVKLI
ncbi:MAG: KamA family radical SAM protein [Spirochaetes bacterium]|nr:KamA family radical SAM protein [Spirochaetota bacterium]